MIAWALMAGALNPPAAAGGLRPGAIANADDLPDSLPIDDPPPVEE